MTSVLRTATNRRRDPSIQKDQVLVELMENSLQAVLESKRNPDTYNKAYIALSKIDQESTPKTHYADAYESGHIEDYETLDKIQTVLEVIRGEREREIKTLETIVGINKASSQLDSEKAADAATGNK